MGDPQFDFPLLLVSRLAKTAIPKKGFVTVLQYYNVPILKLFKGYVSIVLETLVQSQNYKKHTSCKVRISVRNKS